MIYGRCGTNERKLYMRRKASRAECALSTCKYTRTHRAPWKRPRRARRTPRRPFFSNRNALAHKQCARRKCIRFALRRRNGRRGIVLLHSMRAERLSLLSVLHTFFSLQPFSFSFIPFSDCHTSRISRMHLLFDISIYVNAFFFFHAVANFTRLCISSPNFNVLILTMIPQKRDLLKHFISSNFSPHFCLAFHAIARFKGEPMSPAPRYGVVMTLCS